MRLCEAREKEVINLCDCKRLGYVEDVLFDCCTGKVEAFVIPAGGKFTLEAKTTSPVKKDEVIYTITLITNSPNRPLVNLFIVGNTN